MKTEILEKIRNILEYLFELFIFILIMLITFGSLHVHAEESNVQQELTGKVTVSVVNDYYGYDGVVTYEFKNNLSLDIYDVCGFLNTSSDSVVPSITNQSIDFLCKNKKDGSISFVSDAVIITNVSSSGVVEPKYQVGSTLQSFTADQSRKRVDNNIVWYYFYEYDSGNYPIAKDSTSAKNYLLTGDISGIINGGGSIDNPDFEDSAYAFTGFTANNKMTATWTGTTERSYLKDQEVEEYVRVNYYFADKEAQDTIKQADAYPVEFATADKTLTIDVSGLKTDDENWFLRYIRITPCYRQAGLGAWGDFYHGEPSYVYFNQDGSIDRIDAPYIKGELSSDMERPVIVLHEAANGNPTESDYSYFEFNNAQSDYFFEMKGRWYTTNDFDLYRDKLVWKYKYSTLLKNNLSTWVSVSDNRSSVGRFKFDVLGKSSWDNLLSSYPVDDRNYIGGSYNLFNKITGYSDALETLKMLLKQPYSLFNGYEVYVRYFRYDENGGIQYSKWTHFYNNLADSDGSSGSRLDDLDNMYSENQSDKGLTDDELSDLENGGNSRNDLDAVPKNNYDYSSLENATMNFFDLLKNFGTMLGQFPSMVAAVFGFLPSWLIGLIAVAIGAVIVCRFIGR